MKSSDNKYKRDPFEIINTDFYPENEIWRIANQFAIPPLVFEKFNSTSDSVLSGTRGTGKSMLLRFFSFETQAQYYNKYGKVHAIYDDLRFIGSYWKVRGEMLPIGQSNLLSINELEYSYTTAQLNLKLLYFLIKELKFANKVKLIDINKSFISNISAIANIKEKCQDINVLHLKVQENLTKLISDWHTSTPQAENPLFQSTFLNEIIKEVYASELTCGKSHAFLIDEVDRFSIYQQRTLNTLIDDNEPPNYFKIGTLPYLWERNKKVGALKIPDDIQLCEIDREIDSYREFLKELCNNRFIDIWGINLDIEDHVLGKEYSPSKAILNQYFTKTKLTEQFGILRGESLIKKKDEDNKIKRRKSIMKYYGYTTCVKLSSGVVRNFIDLIREIILTAKSESKWNPENEIAINQQIQDDVIEDKAEAFKKDAAKTDKDYADILTIVNYFGEGCHERFWNSKDSEGECIRIEIMDYYKLNPEIMHILEKCVGYGLLQEEKQKRRSTFSKGMGSSKFYLLNQILTPCYLIPPVDHQTYRTNSNTLNNFFYTGQARLELFEQLPPEHFDEHLEKDKLDAILLNFQGLPAGNRNKVHIKYQDYVKILFEFIFREKLTFVGKEVTTFDGVRRKDIIFRIEPIPDRFFDQMKKNYNSDYLIIDAKNSIEPVSSELDTISKYLNEKIGRFAIVSIRGNDEKLPARYLKHAAIIAKEDDKILLIINDRDIIEMYNNKIRKHTPSDILQNRYDQFINRVR